jgi:hypothetical protein
MRMRCKNADKTHSWKDAKGKLRSFESASTLVDFCIPWNTTE